MAKPLYLAERKDYFLFEHKPSEVNYGGKSRFHQIAFPPADAQDQNDFETLIFHTIHAFTGLLQEKSGKPQTIFPGWATEVAEVNIEPGAKKWHIPGWYREFTDCYFDQLCATPFLDWHRYQFWVEHELLELCRAYYTYRANAYFQESLAAIPRLNYLLALGMTTLIAEYISDYFEKQIDCLGKVASMARFTLGRCIAWAFLKIEESDQLKKIRFDKINEEKIDPGVARLLNPFSLAFINHADEGMIDEILSGPNPHGLSYALRKNLQTMLVTIFEKNRNIQAQHITACIAEPSLWQQLADKRPLRRQLLKYLRKNHEMRVRLVAEQSSQDLRQVIRESLRQGAEGSDLVNAATNDRQLEEILIRKALLKRYVKLCRAQPPALKVALQNAAEEGAWLLQKSQRKLFGRLLTADLLELLGRTIIRYSALMAQIKDFQFLRHHYGQDSNRTLQWQGLKVWHIYEMHLNPNNLISGQSLLVSLWEKKRQELNNHFEEGNLFFGRNHGEIYPHDKQRRTQVIFMFADLRNSTETTMKLTKDTASYLTPYLSAVNSNALKNHGQRIYFAGDGYAAYYQNVSQAIRAAYAISEQFYRLHKLSGEEMVREAKEIYQHAAQLGMELNKPRKIKQKLKEMDVKTLSIKTLELLNTIAESEEETLSDESLKKILARIASANTMPRVDVGIALTNGELFFAMVSDDDRENENKKISIVISPQLTQAARLSGSADAVKAYLDAKYSPPLPFNVYAYDQKLYNRGIAITESLFKQLNTEEDVHAFSSSHPAFKGEKLFSYFDNELKKNLIIRENRNLVMLKGIAQPCKVYEVGTTASLLDKQFETMGK